jgi:CheY-like chemotaxis protein
MSNQRSRLRVLVVDDSPAALHMICSYLSQREFVEIAATASGGPEALALLEQLKPSLVVMDIQMPGMSGLETVTRISQQHPSVPVILVTAHDSPDLEKASHVCGAFGFARKQRLNQDLPGLLERLRAA